MRVVDLDRRLVLRQGPLYVSDIGIKGDDIRPLAEADDGEVAAGELHAAFFVDEVEDGAGDLDEHLLGGKRRGGGADVVGEEVSDLVDFGVEIGRRVGRARFGVCINYYLRIETVFLVGVFGCHC